MADIECFIKIPEEIAERLLAQMKLDRNFTQCEIKILPQHGRLGDLDAIQKEILSALGIRNENYLLPAEKALFERIKNADTVIDATEDITREQEEKDL